MPRQVIPTRSNFITRGGPRGGGQVTVHHQIPRLPVGAQDEPAISVHGRLLVAVVSPAGLVGHFAVEIVLYLSQRYLAVTVPPSMTSRRQELR